jgi:alkylation response protein AidB-like acyl-CoA dehydrogenase
MRGTGTHDFAVSDVFVPGERTVLSVTAPLLEPGPLYRIPRTLLFASGDAAIALGVARASLGVFLELAGAKTPRGMPAPLRDQPTIQADLGHAEAHLRSGRALLTETVREVWTDVSATGAISLDQRAALRLATTHAIRLAVRVVDIVYNAAGATAVYEGNLLQRHFQDVHVISQHLQARLAHYELVGRHWLGLPVDEAKL